MKKQGGKLVPDDLGRGREDRGDALKKAGANAGFIAAGSLTNEEAIAVQKLARDVAGSAEYRYPGISLRRRRDRRTCARSTAMPGIAIASQADLSSADCVVVIGADPSQKGQSLQEIDVMIRRRAQAGAKIIVVSTEKIGLAHHANAILLQLKAGTDTALLAGVMSAALAEGADLRPRRGSMA